MERLYYIVEHRYEGKPIWQAHRGGVRAFFGIYDMWNTISDSYSFRGAEHCEEKLRQWAEAKNFEPKVVRIVKL